MARHSSIFAIVYVAEENFNVVYKCMNNNKGHKEMWMIMKIKLTGFGKEISQTKVESS